MALHSDETKLKEQSGDMPTPAKAPKPIDKAMRSSKPGLPFTGAPGHSMPKN